MTEEEKESIEIIKAIISMRKENKSTTTMLYVSDVDILLNLIEKLQKENEELKEKVFKRDKELIRLEEYANKNFERKDDVKARYIPKGKIKEVKQYLEYYLIGNLKYENCQDEFKKILKLLEEE